MIPASHLRWRTAKESRGVERASGNRKTLNPAAARTRAQSSANSGELCRVSRAITHDRGVPLPCGRDVVGQAAGTLGDRPLVQDVGADRVHHAPPAAGAELEDGVEGVVEDFPPACGDILEQPGRYRAKGLSVNHRPIAAAAEAESAPVARPGPRCQCVFDCGHDYFLRVLGLSTWPQG